MKLRQLKLENQVNDSAEADKIKYRKTNISYLETWEMGLKS